MLWKTGLKIKGMHKSSDKINIRQKINEGIDFEQN